MACNECIFGTIIPAALNRYAWRAPPSLYKDAKRALRVAAAVGPSVSNQHQYAWSSAFDPEREGVFVRRVPFGPHAAANVVVEVTLVDLQWHVALRPRIRLLNRIPTELQVRRFSPSALLGGTGAAGACNTLRASVLISIALSPGSPAWSHGRVLGSCVYFGAFASTKNWRITCKLRDAALSDIVFSSMFFVSPGIRFA